jgi:RNase P subunit RPR2
VTDAATDAAMVELASRAARVLYTCRLYKPEHRGARGLQRLTCVDCRRVVVVTPAVLADRRRFAREAGRVLEIVCDDCGVASANRVGMAIVAMSTQAELDAAPEASA